MTMMEIILKIILIISDYFKINEFNIADKFFIEFQDDEFIPMGDVFRCLEQLKSELGDKAEFVIGYKYEKDGPFHIWPNGIKVYIRHSIRDSAELNRRRAKFEYLISNYSKISYYSIHVALKDTLYACLKQFNANDNGYCSENKIRLQDADLHFAALVIASARRGLKPDLHMTIYQENLVEPIINGLDCNPRAHIVSKYIHYLIA